MKLSLGMKLLLAFVVVGLAGTAILALLAATATEGEFISFMFDFRRQGMAAQLADYYAQNETWEGVPPSFSERSFGFPRRIGGPGQSFIPFLLVDREGRVVVPMPGHVRGELISAETLTDAVPIDVGGQSVGRLVLPSEAFGQDPAEGAFLERVNLALGLGALGGTAAAVVLGAVLVRSLNRPLRELTEGARAVAAGDLEIQVPVRSYDEMGELATAFNQMNTNLARSRELRRQMTADIAHELRTPLSIILGHAEGIKEGVLPSSAANLQVIHEEAARLDRLVEDLRTLSLVEAGELPLELSEIEPAVLLRKAAASYQASAKRKSIELAVLAEDSLPMIEADSDRFIQVLGNLIANALHHAPDGGAVSLSATPINGRLQISVADNGPGIHPSDLPHIFDRFYRADKSRQRDGAGSGLGLAIAKSLVEAHAGNIRAESELGHGTHLIIELPLRA
jgi:two-component system sensor histidine kinase BaeS